MDWFVVLRILSVIVRIWLILFLVILFLVILFLVILFLVIVFMVIFGFILVFVVKCSLFSFGDWSNGMSLGCNCEDRRCLLFCMKYLVGMLLSMLNVFFELRVLNLIFFKMKLFEWVWELIIFVCLLLCSVVINYFVVGLICWFVRIINLILVIMVFLCVL